MRRATLFSGFCCAVLALTFAPPSAQATVNCATTTSPLTDSFVAGWVAKYHARNYQIAVIDLTNNCEYTRSTTSSGLPTASVVKAGIAIAAMEDITAQRYSYSSVLPIMRPMLRVSDNTAATTMYRKTGRAAMIRRLAKHYRLSTTQPASSWGVTTTTALDQAHLLQRAVVRPNRYISVTNQQRLLTLMRGVTPAQRWGAGYGLPKGWKVAVKNGWYPKGRWRVNTIGYVSDSSGRPRWVLAGFSNGWSTFGQGTRAWNALSKQVVRTLG